jgi:hypothetical protein
MLDFLGDPSTSQLAAVWGTALAALVLTGQPTSWRVLRHVVTIAHEGGHAVAAVLVGRRLSGIRLHSDTSGVTVSSGRPHGPGMVLTAAAGYPAPSVLGVALAALIGVNRTTAALWLALVLLVAVLTQIRNVFGGISVVGTGAATFAAIWWGTATVQLAFAAALTWLLLIGGGRAVLELQRTRSRLRGHGPQYQTSDADQLARLTPLPALVWVGVFLLASVAGLLGGGWLILTWFAA